MITVPTKKGKWLAACDLSNDWLVCGGSVPLSAWFLRNLSSPASVFDCDSKTQCLKIHDGTIYSGGNDGKLHEWSINGDHNRFIEVNAKDVYSIHHSAYLTVGGTSNLIDTFTLPARYSAFRLSVL